MEDFLKKGVRILDLTKHLDPEIETRRCKLERFNTGGPIPDFHTNMDLMSHLGTHVECPYHHNDNWKDVEELPVSTFIGRCIYLNFDKLKENTYIMPEDLEEYAKGRVGEGDVLILDSPYKIEPFTEKTNTDEDKRLLICRETAEWLRDKKVKCVGFGDGVSIESNNKDVSAFHDVLMEQDVVFLEVLKNLEQLEQEVFLLAYLPIPIKGLDSCPVRVVAIEGLSEFNK